MNLLEQQEFWQTVVKGAVKLRLDAGDLWLKNRGYCWPKTGEPQENHDFDSNGHCRRCGWQRE